MMQTPAIHLCDSLSPDAPRQLVPVVHASGRSLASTSMAVTHLPAAAYTVMPWKNGKGVTREVVAWRPLPSAAFTFRLSMADLNHGDSEYSRFPGIDRALVILEGDGVVLRTGDRPPLPMVPRETLAFFSGDDATSSCLTSPSGRDLNVMWDRSVLSPVVRLASGDDVTVDASANGHVFVVAVGGDAIVGVDGASHVVADGDTLHVRSDDKPTVVTIRCRAQALVVVL